MPKLKPQTAKAKGREHQKWICEQLNEVFGFRDGDLESRSMGANGADVMMSPHARDTFPFSIEAKHTRTHPTNKVMEQAKENRFPYTIPAIVWKPHGCRKVETMITMNFIDFIEIWKEHTQKKKEDEDEED